jgi:alkylhydroperoxidase family enzyme
MTDTMGFVPNAFKVFSPSPFLLERQVSSLGYYMRHATLSGKLLAMIRMLVSVDEECTYCVGTNAGILFHYGVLPEQVAEIKADPSKAPLDAKELPMLLFVLKAVKESNAVTPADVDDLRNLGWSDAEILEAAYHGASAVASDRIFNAFKITADR